MTDSRIKAAQEEIQTILEPKPEYVVNTSEFNDVKNRLAMLHNHRKVDSKDNDPTRPTLRRAPGSSGSGSDSTDGTKTDSDDRPTLKRRDSGGNGN